MASKRLSDYEKRSLAAKKGWETRRKRNPLRYGKSSVSKRKERRKELENQLIENVKKVKQEILDRPQRERIERREEKLRQQRINLEIFGTEKPDTWKQTLYRNMRNFIEEVDAREDHEAIEKAWRKWHSAKARAKKRLSAEEFRQLMFMIGSSVPLRSEGKFSIMSFITS